MKLVQEVKNAYRNSAGKCRDHFEVLDLRGRIFIVHISGTGLMAWNGYSRLGTGYICWYF
jgi:hypothetical protein